MMSTRVINLECHDEVMTSSQDPSEEVAFAVDEKFLYPHHALNDEAIRFQVPPFRMKELPFPEIEYIRPGCIVLTYFTESPQTMVDDHFFSQVVCTEDFPKSIHPARPLEVDIIKITIRVNCTFPTRTQRRFEYPQSLEGLKLKGLKDEGRTVCKAVDQVSKTPPSDTCPLPPRQLSTPSELTDWKCPQHHSSWEDRDSLKGKRPIKETFERPDCCEEVQEEGMSTKKLSSDEDLSFEHLLQYFTDNSPNIELFRDEPPTDCSESDPMIPFSDQNSYRYSDFDASFHRGTISSVASSHFDQTGNAIDEHRSFQFRPCAYSTPSHSVPVNDHVVAMDEMEFME